MVPQKLEQSFGLALSNALDTYCLFWLYPKKCEKCWWTNLNNNTKHEILVVFQRFSDTPTIKRWCAQKCCQVDAKWMQRARNRLNVLLLNAIYPHVVSGLKPIFRSIKNTQDSRAISCRATVWRQKLHGSVHRVVSLQQPMFGQWNQLSMVSMATWSTEDLERHLAAAQSWNRTCVADVVWAQWTTDWIFC